MWCFRFSVRLAGRFNLVVVALSLGFFDNSFYNLVYLFHTTMSATVLTTITIP